MTDVVGKWTAVTTLEISFPDLGSAGTIFKNGLNQILVMLTVTPTDSKNKVLNEGNSKGITKQVTDAAGLIDFHGRQRLQFLPPDQKVGIRWSYTSERNNFGLGSSSRAASVSNITPKDDNEIVIPFYVTCPDVTPLPDKITICAQINVPREGGGTSSQDTAGTVNSGVPRQSLDIKAIPAIRYTEANTTLNSQEYPTENSSPNRKMVARNYWLTCNYSGYDFVQMQLIGHEVYGEYWHVLDAKSNFQQNPSDKFYSYRKFNIAYIWNTTDKTANVFNMRPSPNDAPEVWHVDINQNNDQDPPRAQYFTVVEYDATIGLGRGIGYPGPDINYTSENGATGATGNIYFQIWDQYGNSGIFYPTTSTLLDEFKVKAR